MTRDFDPVFSSALRTRLERLPDAAPQRATPARRLRALVQQGLVASAVLALVLASSAGALRIAAIRSAPGAEKALALPTALPFVRGHSHSGDVTVAAARSGTAIATGLLPASTRFLKMDLNCQGPGIILVKLSNGQSTAFTHPVGRPTPGHPTDFNIGCEPKAPVTAEIVMPINPQKSTSPLRYTVSVARGPAVWSLLFIKTDSPNS